MRSCVPLLRLGNEPKLRELPSCWRGEPILSWLGESHEMLRNQDRLRQSREEPIYAAMTRLTIGWRPASQTFSNHFLSPLACERTARQPFSDGRFAYKVFHLNTCPYSPALANGTAPSAGSECLRSSRNRSRELADTATSIGKCASAPSGHRHLFWASQGSGS